MSANANIYTYTHKYFFNFKYSKWPPYILVQLCRQCILTFARPHEGSDVSGRHLRRAWRYSWWRHSPCLAVREIAVLGWTQVKLSNIRAVLLLAGHNTTLWYYCLFRRFVISLVVTNITALLILKLFITRFSPPSCCFLCLRSWYSSRHTVLRYLGSVLFCSGN
jgi:hypothetical protein